jgi:hypothetical protein
MRTLVAGLRAGAHPATAAESAAEDATHRPRPRCVPSRRPPAWTAT